MSEDTTNSTSATPQPEETPVAPTSIDSKKAGNRIYISNLSFKTSYNAVKELLAEYKAVTTRLPTVKTPTKAGKLVFRKLGYAFADFETKEDAEKAVAGLHEKEVDDRKIVVKLDDPARKSKKKSSKSKSKESATSQGSETKSSDDTEKADTSAAESNGTDSEPKSKPKSKPKADAKPKPRRQVGPESSDIAFVANAPVGTTVEELTELFKDLSPEEVKIVTKRPKKFKKKGELIVRPAKLLSFIKFADEPTRQKAIDQFNGQQFKDVTLEVKVATELVVTEDQPTEAAAASDEQATADDSEV